LGELKLENLEEKKLDELGEKRTCFEEVFELLPGDTGKLGRRRSVVMIDRTQTQ
jgi:hypothetical protein